MGRELKRIGAPFSQPLWSAQALIESPRDVARAHQSFIDAGADWIITNAYACVPFHLGDELFNSDGFLLAQKAARIAREVATENRQNVRVLGCIPPAMGSYRPDLFDEDAARRINNILVKGQQEFADSWIAETISSLAELSVVSDALRCTDKPVYYAFTLKDDADGDARLRSGERVSDAVQLAIDANATGILFNCSIPEVMARAVIDASELTGAAASDIHIGVYANSFTAIGESHQANTSVQSLRDISPEDYLVYCQKWHELGATILGGCCGIGPEHIAAMDRWRKETTSL